MHQPEFAVHPQDVIDLDLSSSLMRFLRAMGPDIPVNMSLTESNGDSSSSSDATSLIPKEELR